MSNHTPLKPGRFLTLRQVKRDLLPDRSKRWLWERVKRGDFGPDAVLDAAGWLIPESGVMAYLERHRVQTAAAAESQSHAV